MIGDMNFKTLESKVVFNGHIKVKQDRLQLPNGRLMTYDYIDTIRAVLILPILEDSILMLKQYRHPLKRVVFDLPAGGIRPNESTLAAAQRELQEETGFSTQDFHYLGRFNHIPGCLDSVVHTFAANNLHAGQANLDPTEFVEPVRVPIVEFEDFVEHNEMEATIPLTYFLAKRKGLLPT